MTDEAESKETPAPIDRGTTVPIRADAPRSDPNAPTPVGDSPWLYLLLFTSFALFGLFAISAKYAKRQQDVEREYIGIRTMQEDQAGIRDADAEPLDAEQTPLMITLRPLFLVVGLFSLFGWTMLLWRGTGRQSRLLEEPIPPDEESRHATQPENAP